jgi:hypothetical protein
LDIDAEMTGYDELMFNIHPPVLVMKGENWVMEAGIEIGRCS